MRATPWIASLLLLSAPSLAQQPADSITGSAALGYLATSGNTDSSNANASFRLRFDPTEVWRHEWTAQAVSARTDDVSTAESYSAGYRARRRLAETGYLAAIGDWRKDRFSGYERQTAQTIGYGRDFIETERHVLSVEGGAGAKQSKLVDGTSLDEGIVRGGLDYLLTITDTAEFNQRLLTEIGQDNRYSESVSALRMRLINDIAVVLSYTVRNNSDVPPGIERTDTFTAISFEYGF